MSGSIYLPTIYLDLCVHVKLLQLCLTLCDVMDVCYQAPQSMGFSRQQYWSGLPCPTLGDLPDPGLEPESLKYPSLALADRFFATSTTWEALHECILWLKSIEKGNYHFKNIIS